jgi:hypothetical protein
MSPSLDPPTGRQPSVPNCLEWRPSAFASHPHECVAFGTLARAITFGASSRARPGLNLRRETGRVGTKRTTTMPTARTTAEADRPGAEVRPLEARQLPEDRAASGAACAACRGSLDRCGRRACRLLARPDVRAARRRPPPELQRALDASIRATCERCERGRSPPPGVRHVPGWAKRRLRGLLAELPPRSEAR